ncbi:hypothetical protein PNEG_02389 [Pneumocystis murina B123]|uniref:Uncharacterized protein n=1 Tax=Pneumocystis murina (strain B123) TaxID=1069680 RepID=M7NQA0_PNEMU|nr:hypothetical protein PNEG_02389 [Pneumocystis murina B123]EMR09447.1 hypothetical protein PNEG_02389 [Pneumocystis murina B123]
MMNGFQKFAEKCRKYALISFDNEDLLHFSMDDSYEFKLDEIIRDLNEKILYQTEFLKNVKESNVVISDSFSFEKLADLEKSIKNPRERLAWIKHYANIYEESSHTVDFTIDDNFVTGLLARQKIEKNTTEARLTMEILEKRLKKTLSTIEREQKILEESKIIGSLLDQRLKKLEKQSQRSSQEILNECHMNVKEAERSVNKFMRELVRFIDEELGDVLLAEQSGAAVGYADLPEKKHAKLLAESGQTTLDKHISIEQKDKFTLCNSTKELLENLMNQSVLPGADPYIIVEDSVIGRILLRSGLVMLHNKDARKMRLVEFQREIDEMSFI